MPRTKPFAFVAAALMTCYAPHVAALSSCSSDGTPQPTAVFERFLSADCEACWADPATPGPSAGAGALVLDWIVPSPSGDDAPLSAAATRDALARLQLLGRSAPAATDVHVAPVEAPRFARLRVAHGMAFNDYLGTSIAYTAARQPAAPDNAAKAGAWDFYLLLVETVPAGTEGSPVERNIVRNMLQSSWNKHDQLSNLKQSKWLEARSMRAPEGAQPQRLRVVGWVQDAAGRVVAAAQSACR
jgi:hypothetical protein